MNPIRVLVAGHDLGGINLLVPLLRNWAGSQTVKAEFLSAPVLRRDVSHLVPNVVLAHASSDLTEQMCHRRSELDGYLARVLAEGRYDAVICGTSAHALLERRLFLAAPRAGIPTVAFCDMWWAYAERFHDGETWALPDRLWVIDKTMADAAAQVSWPRPLPIDIVGSPLFGELARSRKNSGRNGSAIRFISEPVSTKFPDARIDEFALADMLVSSVCAAGLESTVVIRPHPADSQEGWRRWVFSRRNQGVALETLPIDEAIPDTARAVGISSILLTEMRMCGVPVASLQPRDADLSYYCLPFESLGIARIADASELASWLAALADNGLPADMAIHLNATAHATHLLTSLVQAGRHSVS